MNISNLFKEPIKVEGNFIEIISGSDKRNQEQTNQVFSDKWKEVSKNIPDRSKNIAFQRKWYLDLYGFKSEDDFKNYLSDKPVIFDAGCGLGEKAAWFAELAPNSIVVGMDFSEAVYLAKDKFKDYANLFFIRGDIAKTKFRDGVIDYISCDQVIMHTEKALPRELLDSFFRKKTHNISSEELWEFSAQLTELGKNLSELNVKVEIPNMPLIGIEGGEYDIQRFLYWNFLKCFWNDDLGYETSKATNFDWYAPSNAQTYSKEEFNEWISKNKMISIYFHQEEACYSGRFRK